MGESQQSDPARIYEEYLGRTIADPWTRILLEYASVGSGERVLDLACGTGRVARQVAPIVGERGKVTALDINPGMLAVARSLDPPDGAPIEWLQGDALALQFLGKGGFEYSAVGDVGRDGHHQHIVHLLAVETFRLPDVGHAGGAAGSQQQKKGGKAGQ